MQLRWKDRKIIACNLQCGWEIIYNHERCVIFGHHCATDTACLEDHQQGQKTKVLVSFFCKSGFRELKPWQLHFTLFILGNFVRPSTSTHNQELEVSNVLSVSVAWLECFILVCAVWYIFQTMTFVLHMSR